MLQDEVALYFPQLGPALRHYASALKSVEEALTRGDAVDGVDAIDSNSGDGVIAHLRTLPLEQVAQLLAPREITADATDTGAGGRMTKAQKQAQKAQRKADRKKGVRK